MKTPVAHAIDVGRCLHSAFSLHHQKEGMAAFANIQSAIIGQLPNGAVAVRNTSFGGRV
jgi:hypothetical protein